MKKLLCLFFTVLFLFNTFMPLSANAISAQCYCVIDSVTGRILYEKNAYTKHGMASTTKIMTAIVALERAKPDDIAKVSYNASRIEGSSLYLKPGEQMTISDLVYGLMLNSGNDAAVVLAEHIGGDVENFAEIMNETAIKIGAKSTHFTNPNGLFDENHYTTAYDLALITRYAMKNEEFKKIVSTKKYTVQTIDTKRNIYLSNHNKLLNRLEGCTGVKTGFTKKTGRCLVSSAERSGVSVICTTLNASDDWNDHTHLINLAFEEYKPKKIISEGQYIKTIPVTDGVSDCVGVAAGKDIYILAKEKEALNCEILYDIAENFSAPVYEGSEAGSVSVVYNGEKIDSCSVYTNGAVDKLVRVTYLDKVKKIFELLMF